MLITREVPAPKSTNLDGSATQAQQRFEILGFAQND
jgi:hypothetical protein